MIELQKRPNVNCTRRGGIGRRKGPSRQSEAGGGALGRSSWGWAFPELVCFKGETGMGAGPKRGMANLEEEPDWGRGQTREINERRG